ncbi:MAG: DNA-processing protein DprA [Pseudomonadota bacterium]
MIGQALNGLPDLTYEQKLAWLQLIRSAGVGPITFRDLLNFCGSAENAVDRLPELAAKTPGKKIRIHRRVDAEREMDGLMKRGWRLVARCESDYPQALSHVPTAPPLIAVAGDVEALRRPAISIVGSRNTSANGLRLAGMIATEISQAGMTVVSGFARGIDTAAHKGALVPGGTVGVFAGGLDIIYPAENLDLANAMVDNGCCMISELALGTKPRAQDFPRRNRIVAGLALATCVVEANPRSGSLITARLANEMGRLVFAVPGSPLDPRARGANKLIAEGASILTDPSDIVDAILPLIESEESFRSAVTIHKPTTKKASGPTGSQGELLESGDDQDRLVQELLSDDDLGAKLAESLNFQENASGYAQEAEQENHTDPKAQVAVTGTLKGEAITPQDLLGFLSASPTHMNDLIRMSGVPQSQLRLLIMELVMSGLVEDEGGYVTRLDR